MSSLEKKLSNIVIWILSISTVVFFVMGDYLKVAGFAVSLVLVMLPEYLFENWTRFARRFNKNFITRSQMMIAVACYLNLLGSADFYLYNGYTRWYDTVVHFINPVMLFSLSAAAPILLQKIFFKNARLWLTLLLNFFLIILFSFFWEFYEAMIDALFTGSGMLGQRGELLWDTITDLSADFIGGLFGLWLLYTRFYGYILKNVK